MEFASLEEAPPAPPIQTVRLLPHHWGVDNMETDCGYACTPNGCSGHVTDIPEVVDLDGLRLELQVEDLDGTDWDRAYLFGVLIDFLRGEFDTNDDLRQRAEARLNKALADRQALPARQPVLPKPELFGVADFLQQVRNGNYNEHDGKALYVDQPSHHAQETSVFSDQGQIVPPPSWAKAVHWWAK